MSESAGVFMQFFGSAMSAGSQVSAGNYNKQIADYNAKIAEYQAQDAITRGELAVDRQRKGVKQLIGSQRASLAAQGVDVNEGSAVDLQADTAYQGEYDALMIRNNAALEAWGFKVQAWNATEQGKMADRSGKNKAFSTILGAGSSALKQYGFSAPTYSSGGYSGSQWSDGQ